MCMYVCAVAAVAEYINVFICMYLCMCLCIFIVKAGKFVPFLLQNKNNNNDKLHVY